MVSFTAKNRLGSSKETLDFRCKRAGFVVNSVPVQETGSEIGGISGSGCGRARASRARRVHSARARARICLRIVEPHRVINLHWHL